MIPDYAPAIPFWAHPTNYRTTDAAGNPRVNRPLGFVLHTPEEPADDYAYTPRFFADPNRDASTHYFASFTGDIYQCVPESAMAIANGVTGKPYPAWADPSRSLNWQTLSVEIEGYAASISTLVIGGAQWRALVALIRDRCRHYGIPLDREHIIGHYEVASNRSDPGDGFPWAALIAALRQEEGGRMLTDDEINAKFGALYGNALHNGADIRAIAGALADHIAHHLGGDGDVADLRARIEAMDARLREAAATLAPAPP